MHHICCWNTILNKMMCFHNEEPKSLWEESDAWSTFIYHLDETEPTPQSAIILTSVYFLPSFVLPGSCGAEKGKPNLEFALEELRSAKSFLTDHIWRLFSFFTPTPLIMLSLSLPCSVLWEADPQGLHHTDSDSLAHRLHLSDGRHQEEIRGQKRVVGVFLSCPCGASALLCFWPWLQLQHLPGGPCSWLCHACHHSIAYHFWIIFCWFVYALLPLLNMFLKSKDLICLVQCLEQCLEHSRGSILFVKKVNAWMNEVI